MIVKITIYEGETPKSLINMFGPINKYSWLWETYNIILTDKKQKCLMIKQEN